jgi:phage shock protein A
MNLRTKSKQEFGHNEPITRDELKVGCLQRIADATEAMAKNHVALQNDCDRYKRWFTEENERRLKLERSNAALRGQITKLKKKKQQTP